ncbi:MAG TPA: hypothetical protein DDY98_07950 [Ruminococcaceae bacterium]|nr:hypothetical protein [Oscillospiraceae bacterium]
MEIVKIVSVAVLSCVLVKLVGSYRSDMALLIQLGTVVLLLACISSSVLELMSQTRKLSAWMNFDSGYLSLLLKALIVSLSCGVAGEICSDSGNGAIRFCVELAGRVSLLLMTLPLLTVLAQFALKLVGAKE